MKPFDVPLKSAKRNLHIFETLETQKAKDIVKRVK